MKKLIRWFPFILLNILISAMTTLGVLWWWENYQRPVLPKNISTGALPSVIAETTPVVNPASGGESQPGEQTEIVIVSVFGAGDQANEAVMIRQTGAGETWLTGWRLLDENGNVYTFPELLLNQNGAVQVFTRPGIDSVIELYWGLEFPVWSSGEKASLLDNSNDIRAVYQIP